MALARRSKHFMAAARVRAVLSPRRLIVGHVSPSAPSVRESQTEPEQRQNKPNLELAGSWLSEAAASRGSLDRSVCRAFPSVLLSVRLSSGHNFTHHNIVACGQRWLPVFSSV